MRNKIFLLGMRDIEDFVARIHNVEGNIEVFNPKNGHRVSAHSTLGLLMAVSEWGEDIWVDSEKDIYSKIEKYIVISEGDGAFIHS